MSKGSMRRPTKEERYCAEYERLFGKGGPAPSVRKEPPSPDGAGRKDNAGDGKGDTDAKGPEPPAPAEVKE